MNDQSYPRIKLNLIVFSLCLLLAACTSSNQPDGPFDIPVPQTEAATENVITENRADYFVDYVEDECPFDVSADEGITCGYLTVPEDRTVEDGLTLDIAVAIIDSLSDNPQPDPVLYLDGGPGGSALVGIDDWLESAVREERQIILFDQRGTGFSWPNLDCPETDAFDAGDVPEGVPRIEAVEECRDRLRSIGADLAKYNSAASAADVADLRRMLQIDEWNLFGISYGTRLALTVLRDHPAGVRSVVIDSVYPPNVDAYTESAKTQADAILAMVRGCAADADCSAWYPDLETELLNAIDDLNAEPFETEDAFYVGDDLVNALVSALYDSELITQLPMAISEAALGNHDLWLSLEEGEGEEGASRRRQLLRQDDFDPEDSQGMFYSVECHEETPFGDIDAAYDLMADYPPQIAEPLLAELEELYEVCAIWGADEADAIEGQAVESTIPTLILTGEYDPVTPPSWAQLAAETLSDHLYVEVPRGGHSVTSDGSCTEQIVVAFVDSLETNSAAVDVSCVQEVRPFEGP